MPNKTSIVVYFLQAGQICDAEKAYRESGSPELSGAAAGEVRRACARFDINPARFGAAAPAAPAPATSGVAAFLKMLGF